MGVMLAMANAVMTKVGFGNRRARTKGDRNRERQEER